MKSYYVRQTFTQPDGYRERMYNADSVDAALAAKDAEVSRWKMMHKVAEDQLNDYIIRARDAEARERELLVANKLQIHNELLRKSLEWTKEQLLFEETPKGLNWAYNAKENIMKPVPPELAAVILGREA